MKKFLTWFAAIALATTAFAQNADFFTPYKSTSLRLPSVPIFVNDPYVSFWSSYDKLTDGNTSYWYSRNVDKPISGMLRVDGQVYRFMGGEREYILGDALLPMADVGAWTAAVTFTKQNYRKDKDRCFYRRCDEITAVPVFFHHDVIAEQD